MMSRTILLGMLCLSMLMLVVVHGFYLAPLTPQGARGMLQMRERKCDITGRRRNSKCMAVSKSNQHTHRVQHVNLQTCKLWWEEGHKFVKIRIATRTLKTIRKNGLHQTAKKHGVNLNQFACSSGTAPPKKPINDVDVVVETAATTSVVDA